MRSGLMPLFFCIALFAFGQASAEGGEEMKISSAAFKDGGKIPMEYVMPGAGGKNVSVPLTWTNPPAGTRSFALSMVDPHPVARNWVHWLVVGIPATVTSLDAGASRKGMPPGCIELKNSFGDIGYGGPEPPKGTGDHPYVFTLYALSADKLDLATDTSLSAFKKALEGKILESATITGKYGR
jgi:Raf kinase inhibitor-like YbhB/YbcL family protein